MTTIWMILTLALSVGAAAGAAEDTAVACRAKSGGAALTCLSKWTKIVEKCRKKGDPSCEDAARAEGGALEDVVSAIESAAEKRCDDEVAFELGYIDEADVTRRLEDACRDWGEDALAAANGDEAAEPKCQAAVTSQLRKLRFGVIRAEGRKCILKEARGKSCDRGKRDAAIARLATRAEKKIGRKCGSGFDALGLGPLDDVLAQATTNARHFAIIAYPPRDMGQAGTFGPLPVGVRTEPFADASRMNIAGTGPRPVVTEIYYPSTDAAVAGVPREVVQVLGLDITEIPAFRDVAPAPGPHPLVVFSHGNDGIRIQSVAFYLHMASHGYVVAAMDHHGNTFLDTTPDPMVIPNRPLDVSFVIDEMLRVSADGGHLLADSVDADRIGVWGHSFGGLTSFAMVGSGFFPGLQPDPRVKAIMPLAPASPFDQAFYDSIAVPTLVVGGTIDGTTPFESDQRAPYEAMSAAGAFVGLAEIVNGGHFTFSDFCEVDRNLLAFLGGAGEACEPRHLPWRHARERVNYLALNFFDAFLRSDAAALGRLDPAVANAFDDLVLETR